jgi:hypothetical protein
MITSTLVTATSTTIPTKVFVSSTNGTSSGTGQQSAVTTLILCNTGTPSLTNETVDSASVNIYLVKSGTSYGVSNLVVSNLTVPAGETVFFSEERIILDENDEIWIGQYVANPSNPSNTSLVAVTVSSLPV